MGGFISDGGGFGGGGSGTPDNTNLVLHTLNYNVKEYNVYILNNL